jgi:hypothetical protein
MPIAEAFLDYKGRIMKSGYVKSVAIAAFAALGILPVIAQAQLIDLGATTGYALNPHIRRVRVPPATRSLRRPR